MKKNQSAWDRFIFILFQIQKNSYQDITKVHRSKFLTKDLELLGLSYVSLFDRSDSSGTYESIIQNRLQRLSSDNVKLLTIRKGEGIYGIESKDGVNRLNDIVIETREYFKNLNNMFFQKDFIFFEQNDSQFIKTLRNILYTYNCFVKFKILEGSEYSENINKLENWFDIAKQDTAACKKIIAIELQKITNDGIELLAKLKMNNLIVELKNQSKYLDRIIYSTNI